MMAGRRGGWLGALGMIALAACGREGALPGERDDRTGIMVPAAARNAVMTEMRTLLASVNGVLTAQAAGDTAAARQAALPAGTAAAADPALETLLPAAWLSLAMSTHQQFDRLAASAAGPRGLDSITVRLAGITKNCVACHAAYRLEVR